jgi:hypothetical protein
VGEGGLRESTRDALFSKIHIVKGTFGNSILSRPGRSKHEIVLWDWENKLEINYVGRVSSGIARGTN